VGWGPAGWLLRISQFCRLKSTTVPYLVSAQNCTVLKALAAPPAVMAASRNLTQHTVPFKPFLESLAALQAQFMQGDSPIRTAVVTARNAPANERAILTLRDWGITVDEMHFLGGIEKTAVLQVFKPHIFFDDQATHVLAASKDLPSAQVRYSVVGAKKAVASVRPAPDAQQGHEETKVEKG